MAAVDDLDALLLFVDAVDVPAMASFSGRILIVTDFVFVLVFFFFWVSLTLHQTSNQLTHAF